MLISDHSQLTPKETQQMEYEERIFDKQTEYNLEAKRMELEIAKIEAKWSSWLSLPKTIIKLPVYILFAIGYIIAVSLKKEPSENFWKFINK